jgi:MoaA/NifB/PqqE/SkfB family radical SAM enzyme
MDLADKISEENLTIELTTRCTSECLHCFARADRESVHEMNFETVSSILTEGFDLGYRHLHITGGEPLLWPYLEEILALSCKTGYNRILINTNGHLINKSAAKMLAEYKKILHISVSLQGPEEHHDYFRGKGSYLRAISGMETALKEDLPVNIFTTVDRTLISKLPRFIDSCFKKYGAIESHTLIQLVRVHGNNRLLEDYFITPEDFTALVKMTALLRVAGYPVAILENPLASTAARLMSIDWLPPALPLLRMGRLVVLADNSITLAHSVRDSFGTWEPGMLKTVVNSSEYREAAGEESETCLSCRHMSNCRASGIIRPSEWFRNFNDKPFCIEVLDYAESLQD